MKYDSDGLDDMGFVFFLLIVAILITAFIWRFT